MDDIDLAQQQDEFYRRIALDRWHRQRIRPPGGTAGGRRKCADCGKTIGQKRLRANPRAMYCIFCQEKKERGERHG